MKLRFKAPFVVTTAGGITALAADFVWLATDAYFEPFLHLPKWPFFILIGTLFAAALVLMGLGVKWYKQNGYAIHEVGIEAEYRRKKMYQRRYRTIFRGKYLKRYPIIGLVMSK